LRFESQAKRTYGSDRNTALGSRGVGLGLEWKDNLLLQGIASEQLLACAALGEQLLEARSGRDCC